jgi:uncharacterized protein (DUF1684 family)
VDGYLDLADWRRAVAEMYAAWRHESESDPEGATQRLRTAREELFRAHPQTPLRAEDRARFGGLSYFPYDPAYRFTAAVEPAAPPARPELALAMQLPASVTPEFSFRLIGRAHLAGPLAGAVLPVFWMAGYAGGLFVPFRDGTSGSETYGAGRYLLDTVKGADLGGDWQRGELLLDFNTAYHPSCAYDPKWNCPLAPLDSRLTLPVPVGERLSDWMSHAD